MSKNYTANCKKPNYLLKIRGGVEVDSYGKKAGKGALIAEDLVHTLGISQDQYLFQPVGVDILNPHDSQGNQVVNGAGIYPTLRGCGGAGYQQGYVLAPIMVENHPADSRVNIDDSGTCQTLTSRMGTGGGNVPLVVVCETFHCNTEIDRTPPIKARDYKDPLIIAIDRSTFNQGENAKYDISVSGEGTAYTIVARGPGAVCYPKNYNNNCKNYY